MTKSSNLEGVVSQAFRNEIGFMVDTAFIGYAADCPGHDAKRCHRCNGLYWDTIGKDVCPYCGY